MKPQLEQLETRDVPAPVVVVDTQTAVPHDEVARAVEACLYQVNHEVRRAWHTKRDTVRVVTDPSEIRRGEWRVYLFDDPGDFFALGFHGLAGGPFKVDWAQALVQTTKPERLLKHPVTFIPMTTNFNFEGPLWASTLSHEWAEMKVDPFLHYTIPVESWTAAGTQGPRHADLLVEVSDPVEADPYVYFRDGVALSDFVLPSWFNPGSRAKKFDYTGACRKPLQILGGGYQIYLQDGVWWSVILFRKPTVVHVDPTEADLADPFGRGATDRGL